MKINFIKCQNPYFRYVENNLKNVEIRVNDRNYQKNQIYGLLEYSEIKGYTGSVIIIKIIWIDKTFMGLKEGFCMFGFKKLYTGFIIDLNGVNPIPIGE